MEIPLNRLDEEDMALAASLTGTTAPGPEAGRDALAVPDEGAEKQRGRR
ncbi:MAG: hypothetical protein ACLT8E_01520 [Akkermansia sp.]